MMETKLEVVNSVELTEVEKSEINQQIDQIIARHKNNRYEINKLVFESAACLAESENYSVKLSSQGVVKRFWGGITGKNRKLQSNIDSSLAKAQYASQQTLQKLAEQNLMSFELIAAVNNKLNAALVGVEQEINAIYGTLVKFFKQTQSNIVQLENRVEKLERNVSLLNWQNSIEYQMWDGVEYTELRDVEKIVRLTRDFYDITKGKWTTSDLLLLKSAMSSIGLPVKEVIDYKFFIQTVCTSEKLQTALLGYSSLDGVEEYPEYMALTAGINKVKKLESEEGYVLSNLQSLLEKRGIAVEKEELKYELLDEYEKEKANFNIGSQVVLYDFILELLYNLEQLKELQHVKTLPDKMKEAERMFSVYEIDRVFPMLQELADYGFVRAKYMLALIYEIGHTDIECDYEKTDMLLDECISEGYIPALIRKTIPFLRGEKANSEDAKKMMQDSVKILEEFVDKGDMFAAFEYARLCVNKVFYEISEEDDYSRAIRLYELSPMVLGKYELARRYEEGQGVEKNYEKAFDMYMQLSDYGYSPAEFCVSYCLYEGEGCVKDDNKAFKYLSKSMGHGLKFAYHGMGWFYSQGIGVEKNEEKGFEYYLKSAELGKVVSIFNVGYAYLKGKGVSENREMAKQYFLKAAKMGDKTAKEILEEEFDIKILDV